MKTDVVHDQAAADLITSGCAGTLSAVIEAPCDAEKERQVLDVFSGVPDLFLSLLQGCERLRVDQLVINSDGVVRAMLYLMPVEEHPLIAGRPHRIANLKGFERPLSRVLEVWVSDCDELVNAVLSFQVERGTFRSDVAIYMSRSIHEPHEQDLKQAVLAELAARMDSVSLIEVANCTCFVSLRNVRQSQRLSLGRSFLFNSPFWTAVHFGSTDTFRVLLSAGEALTRHVTETFYEHNYIAAASC